MEYCLPRSTPWNLLQFLYTTRSNTYLGTKLDLEMVAFICLVGCNANIGFTMYYYTRKYLLKRRNFDRFHICGQLMYLMWLILQTLSLNASLGNDVRYVCFTCDVLLSNANRQLSFGSYWKNPIGQEHVLHSTHDVSSSISGLELPRISQAIHYPPGCIAARVHSSMDNLGQIFCSIDNHRFAFCVFTCCVTHLQSCDPPN
jgi:hypothetical protein